jgi:hypothetical protein
MMENMHPEAREMMEKMAGGKKNNPPKVTSTGKSKTINGFLCQLYLVAQDNSREQLWITTQFPSLREGFYKLASAMPDANEDVTALWDQIKEGVPIATYSIEDKQGYMSGSYLLNEVYSIEKTSLKKGIFDPPAGYKKTTMQDMMIQGMPGMDN